jgi:membrane protein implicated in regulation of membrane protease activity
MQPWFIWWIVAAVLVGIELTTGTFYLLVYGVAAAIAGMAAWLGASLAIQLLVAALIAAGGTYALRRWKGSNSDHPDASRQGMDIGKVVNVESWSDGRGQVQYRGAVWEAEAESARVDSTQPLKIRAVRGNTLIVGN